MANMDTAEYKHIVLGMIFVKYFSDTLLPCLTSGQLRLPDAETNIEKAAA